MSENNEHKPITWRDLEDMLLNERNDLSWTDELRIRDGHYKRQMSKEDLDFILKVLNYIILCQYDMDVN